MEVQNEIMQKLQEFQIAQQQFQQLISQKNMINQQIMELEEAINELEQSNGKVYKMVGDIFIEKNKEEILSDLKSKKELLEIKLKSMDNQEEIIKNKLIELQKELDQLQSNVKSLHVGK